MPSRIGRFRILRPIGRGGMGVVFAAVDGRLGRRVAIKVVRGSLSERARGRILIEAMAMAKLSHPNVVQIFEVGDEGGRIFIAMEYVEGVTLEAWQTERARDWREVVDIYLQAGEGLAAAHAAGLVHRDFKPHNVMIERALDRGARAVVLDFGLARLSTDPSSADSGPGESEPDWSVVERLTRTGKVVGTPAYMAPEQFQGGAVEPPADQFAFCVSLWEALYGARPFAGDTAGELMSSILTTKPSEPARAGVPARVRDVLRRGLSVRPVDRFGSMRMLLSALRAAARPSRALVYAGLGLAVASTVGGGVAVVRASAGVGACSGAQEAFGALWSSERKAEIRAGLLALDRPYAARAWANVETRLDEQRAAWIAMYEQSCHATRRGEQTESLMDRRTACLQDAHRQLASVVEALERPTVETVDHLQEVLAVVTPLSKCEDAERLLAQVPGPDPDEEAAVQRVRELLSRGDLARRTGRITETEGHLADARAAVAALRYGPVRAEVSRAEGRMLADLERSQEADRVLRDALAEATAWRHWDVARDAAFDLADLLAQQMGRIDEAERYVELAAGWSRGIPDAEIRTLVVRAVVAEKSGRYEDATVSMRAALERQELLSGPDHPKTAEIRANYGVHLLVAGRPAEGRLALERAIRDISRGQGEAHPAVVAWRLTLVDALQQIGAMDAAEVELGIAVEHMQQVPHTDPRRRADAQFARAALLVGQGRGDEAMAVLEALRRQSADIPDPTLPAMIDFNLASVLFEVGAWDRAEAKLEAVLAAEPTTLGLGPQWELEVRRMLANCLVLQGRTRAAVEQLSLGLALARDVGMDASNEASLVRVELAELLLEAGDFDAAILHAGLVRDHEAGGHEAFFARGQASWVLARAKWELAGKDLDRRAVARALAAEALEHLSRTGPAGAPHVETVARWLAQHPGTTGPAAP